MHRVYPRAVNGYVDPGQDDTPFAPYHIKDRTPDTFYVDRQGRLRWWTGTYLQCHHKKHAPSCLECMGSARCVHRRIKYDCVHCTKKWKCVTCV